MKITTLSTRLEPRHVEKKLLVIVHNSIDTENQKKTQQLSSALKRVLAFLFPSVNSLPALTLAQGTVEA